MLVFPEMEPQLQACLDTKKWKVSLEKMKQLQACFDTKQSLASDSNHSPASSDSTHLPPSAQQVIQACRFFHEMPESQMPSRIAQMQCQQAWKHPEDNYSTGQPFHPSPQFLL